MDATVNDEVFGTMSYRHRWYKKSKLTLFGKEWDITVAAKAYSGKPITDLQRKSYGWFNSNKDEIAEQTALELVNYINENCEELAVTWPGARKISRADELTGIVCPTSLLFKQDGTALLLFNCKWDEEHGIAVQIYPEFAIGSQDVFL